MSFSLYLPDVATAFDRCAERLKKRSSVIIGNHTTLRFEAVPPSGDDGVDRSHFVIRYHHSDIIVVHRDRVALDHCGYRTVSTKPRFNEIAGRLIGRVYSQHGEWIVKGRAWGGPITVLRNGKIKGLGASVERLHKASLKAKREGAKRDRIRQRADDRAALEALHDVAKRHFYGSWERAIAALDACSTLSSARVA
jgi:hypothetical protein